MENLTQIPTPNYPKYGFAFKVGNTTIFSRFPIYPTEATAEKMADELLEKMLPHLLLGTNLTVEQIRDAVLEITSNQSEFPEVIRLPLSAVL